MIFKIVRKSLLKKRSLVISIFILVTLATMFTSVSYIVYQSLQSSNDQLRLETKVEDFRLYPIIKIDEQLMKDIEVNENINLDEKLYKNVETTKLPSGTTGDFVYGINQYDSNDVINQVVLESGQLPNNPGEILVQPNFLTYYNLKVGDQLVINNQTYVISGSAYFIDYISPIDSSVLFVANYEKYMPIYMNDTSYQAIDEKEYTYYPATFNDKNPDVQKRMDIEDEIVKKYYLEVPLLNQYGMPQLDDNYQIVMQRVNYFAFAFDTDNNPNISGVQLEINGSSTMFNFISTILVVMTLFLSVVLINGVFKAQRREMGILKAEGVSESRLSIGFMLVLMVLLSIAAITGFVIGIYMSGVLLGFYQSMFILKMVEQPLTFFIYPFIKVLLIALLITVITYVVSIRRNINKKTSNLIKNIDNDQQPRYGFRFITKHLSFKRKYQFNILIRNFSKTILLIVGVLIASFMLLLGTTMLQSINKITSDTYKNVYTYQYEANFSQGINYGVGDNVILKKDVILTTVPEAKKQEKLDEKSKITLYGYEYDKNQYINIRDQNNVKATGDEVIISNTMAVKYGLKVGDSFTFKNPYDQNKEVTLTVDKITDGEFRAYVFVPIEKLRQDLGLTDDYSNGVVGVGDNEEALKAVDPNVTINKVFDLQKMIESTLYLTYIMVFFITVISSIIAFITLYSVTSIIIDSNRKTISVMKVLGYTDREVVSMTTSVYKYVVGLTFILAIPLLEFIIQTIINIAMRDNSFTITIHISYLFAMIGLAVIMSVYFISNYFSRRTISKIKLAESLKSDE